MLNSDHEVSAPSRGDMRVLRIMCTGTFFLCLSQSMLITALPSILREFSVNAGYGQVLTTGYIFALGLIAATTAALVDRFSTKKLFLVSLVSFVVGCVACLVATDFPLLVIGRFLQAGGAGISLPLLQDVALIVYPKEEYGRAMGVVGLVIGFAPAIGPVFAGPLIDMLGWRALFIVLGVIVVAISLLSLFLVRDMARHRKTPFNACSAVLFISGFTALFAGIVQIENVGIADAAAWIPLAIGIVLVAAYVRRDSASASPLLHLHCFRTRRFAIATAFVVYGQASMMIASIMIPLFIQGIQGYSATISGLAIMPGAILLGLLNPVTGRLYDRFGVRALTIGGCTLILLGTAAFVLCTPDTPIWVVTALYGLRILGIAAVWMPMTAEASVALPRNEAMQATAITTSFRQISSATLSTVFVALMAVCTADATGISEGGFDVSFTVLAIVSAVMLVATFFLVKKRRRRV